MKAKSWLVRCRLSSGKFDYRYGEGPTAHQAALYAYGATSPLIEAKPATVRQLQTVKYRKALMDDPTGWHATTKGLV